MELGIDIVDTRRFEQKTLDTPALLERLFTEQEREGKSIRSLAGMFAAKEAVFKADNTITSWHDITITHDPKGKPRARVKGKQVKISIAHEQDTAIAVAQVRQHEKPQ